ncbi:MAG: helix-turn-helix domain-containing protein [Bacteroidales bacterium]|nr:helix-turn-helix domain-containing protein [Bacteroidales bacterium]MCF8455651.1 helix-turn-helix domain-containing protein [Bacteroidales bacterium]
MNLDRTFGDTIKNLRKEKKLTLREVAEALGIDTSMLGKIEKNSRKPTKVLIEKISNFFNVSNKELTIVFLSDTIANQVLEKEDFANEVLVVAEQKVQYLITKKEF